ncbi:hypothetical protein HAZT_HAZT005018 [Hyalella azteca]|uniref:Thyroglobulin type-1 domain-containing protein n=1 Tax=Hyalella azteca TaxID=294128 RepID=A0A6A0H472_HYAAZ|nr:hypothetical protein HAZT_HAZT005018 [Hyalella azteca]
MRISIYGAGGYIPECDSEGWYRPVQCHGSGNLCWCVDRHGVELPYTRTHTKPRCGECVGRVCCIMPYTRTHTKPRCDAVTSGKSPAPEGDDEDDEETVIEGSADVALDI